MRRLLGIIALVPMLLFASCEACGVAKTTADFVSTIIKPVMAIAGAVLPGSVNERYAILQATFDATAAALEKACGDGAKDRSRVLAATNAAVELIEWYKANRPDQALSHRILSDRGLPIPRGGPTDFERALARAAGAKPKAIDVDALLADLKAVRDQVAGR